MISGLAADGDDLSCQLRALSYRGLILGGNGMNTVNVFPVRRCLCNDVLGILSLQPRNPNPHEC